MERRFTTIPNPTRDGAAIHFSWKSPTVEIYPDIIEQMKKMAEEKPNMSWTEIAQSFNFDPQVLPMLLENITFLYPDKRKVKVTPEMLDAINAHIQQPPLFRFDEKQVTYAHEQTAFPFDY